jgi:hypothetical protein
MYYLRPESLTGHWRVDLFPNDHVRHALDSQSTLHDLDDLVLGLGYQSDPVFFRTVLLDQEGTDGNEHDNGVFTFRGGGRVARQSRSE